MAVIEISRWRFDPFTGVEKVINIPAEEHTVTFIPELSRWGIYANEAIKFENPSSVAIVTDDSLLTPYTEVSRFTTPTGNQFRVDYTEDTYFATSLIEFPSTLDGQAVLLSYKGIGTVVHPKFRLNTDFNLPGATVVEGTMEVQGIQTSINTTDSTDKDTGAIICEGGAGIEKNLNVGLGVSAATLNLSNINGFFGVGGLSLTVPGNDLENIIDSGFYNALSTDSNIPATANFGVIANVRSSNDITLEAVRNSLTISEIYVKNKVSGVWGSWFLSTDNIRTVGDVKWNLKRIAPTAAHAYFPLSDNSQILSTLDWHVDFINYFRDFKGVYEPGDGLEQDQYTATNAIRTSNLVTLTYTNLTPENTILTALATDSATQGVFPNGRTVTLLAAIGDIPAGDYDITNLNPASRTIQFNQTGLDGVWAGSFATSFYLFRIAGSTTTAQHFKWDGSALMGGRDSNGEFIMGLSGQDRFEDHRHQYAAHLNVDRSGGANLTSRQGSNTNTTAASTGRTGISTEPRRNIGCYLIYGRAYYGA